LYNLYDNVDAEDDIKTTKQQQQRQRKQRHRQHQRGRVVHSAAAPEEVRDRRLADNGVLGVLVPADRPGTFHVLDVGDDERAAGAGSGRSAAMPRRLAERGRELHDRGGQAAGLDDPGTGGHDGRVLFRHTGVHSPGRRVLEPRLRALHNDVVRGHHGRHVGTGAGRVRPVRELGGRHVSQVPARVRSGRIIELSFFLYEISHNACYHKHVIYISDLHYYSILTKGGGGINRSTS